MKKILLVLSLVFVCVLFVGCKEEKKEYDGKLIVATNAEFAPFEYTDNLGKPIGIDMELASEIAKLLNYDLEIKDMAFDSVLGAIEAKQANVAMAGLTISEKRKQQVDFCDPYFEANQVVIGKIGSKALDINDYDSLIQELEGKKIGFQNGTVAQYFVEGDADWEFNGISGAQAKGFTSGAAAILALKNDQIDYVIIDKVPALQFVEKNKDKINVNVNVSLTEEDYAFAVSKGDTELCEKINNALKTLKDNGKFDEIVNKYYSD